MIERHWRGVAHAAWAEHYVDHLRQSTFPHLATLPGYLGSSILRRDVATGVEFLIITRWVSLEAIRAFAGDDPTLAVVPSVAAEMMVEYDTRAKHFAVVE
jgi:heme-degrading monooxygenase HmoA